MNIIASIAAQRQKLIDGLDANEGEINLRIFEDFYPDEAHFIYELLQNAEDAGATEVSFELYHDLCAFEHNGSRHFNEQDIRGITGIFNSSKKENTDKIGKFGVGFKSVLVYTDTPIIYSKHYSFKILKLVLPVEVSSNPALGERTRFEFPFNNPKKCPEISHSEIKSGLEKLSVTSLLFLNNLRYIQWKVGSEEGSILREEHSSFHVEILKSFGENELTSSHWLRFAESVKDVDKFSAVAETVAQQKVAIAFELEPLSEKFCFDKDVALDKQLKIVPASKGTVSVFFPAEKETSGLRFHLHAPFVPELSRASIKSSPDNIPLFEQLAVLAAKALHGIRDAGLLKADFLSILPNQDELLPERYRVIRQKILDEMKSEPLVPKYGGGYAPAVKLVQSSAVLKTLLNYTDLALVTDRSDSPAWVIGASQKNSNQDRLLGSLGIPNFDVEDLKYFLEENLRIQTYDWSSYSLEDDALNWIRSKSLEWLQCLYSILYRYCNEQDDFGDLSDVFFIRLTHGKIGTANHAYFSNETALEGDSRFYVDPELLTVGSKINQKREAKLFLESLGVRVPDEVDDMTLLLRTTYSKQGKKPSSKQYVRDLKQMIAIAQSHPDRQGIFANAYIFRIDSEHDEWSSPNQVFLDEPFLKTNLKYVNESLSDRKSWPLSDWYLNCGIASETLLQFAKFVGCQTEVDKIYANASCINNPNWNHLCKAPGLRWGNGINRDYILSNEGRILLDARRVETSRMVWNALCKLEKSHTSILQACYRMTEKGGAHTSYSQIVYSLRNIPWIPQTDGSFVKPSEANPRLLPSNFLYEPTFKWMLAIEFGSEDKKKEDESTARAAKRAELGFDSEEDLDRARAFLKLPQEKQRQILEEAERRNQEFDLPERPLRNAEIRQRRVGSEAQAMPGKESVVRERSVQLGVSDSKAAAKLYLSDQYTNSSGVMICQVCKNALPFKLLNGRYYFEAVEVIEESPKRFREAHLALCPNHAAAYKYANNQRDAMQELVSTVSGSELELILGGEVATIYFTETHLADVKACLNTHDEDV